MAPHMRVSFQKDDFQFALATSLVLYGFDGDFLKVLIARKSAAPYQGADVLPSTIVPAQEDPEQVARVLFQRITGREDTDVEKLNGFAAPYRNPEGRVVNLAFYATIRLDEALEERLQDSDYRWEQANEVPPLAYDHEEILAYSRERLKRRVKRRPIGFSMLPKSFTLNQIQRLYEEALGKYLDKRNFRRKLLKSQLLIETGETIRSSPRARRPAALYTFDEKKYRTLSLRGYDFVYQ
ncbi:MAG: NUDIX hydrolase [Schleiferiaceae bacterium]|jgi:8-oxo-dGTP diphosphatase|nr:NUDIX hydrolase [Schleiferiaceae bacterium]